MLHVLKYTVNDISDFSDEELKKCFFQMIPERMDKVRRYQNEIQKKCTIIGELSAKKLLSEASQKPIDSFEIFPDKNGKLKQNNHPGLFFNISHSETKVAVVVADEEVGIDIEVFRPIHLKLAKRICTDEELLYIFGHIPDEAEYLSNKNNDIIRRFLEIWTAKEAYFKCTGKGITDLGKTKSLSSDFNKIKIITDDYVLHIVKDSDINRI